jgi:ADP-ribose pyrophosphatase
MGRIPESAKQVFKGKIFDVWQWEQTMFDGTTATFEMLRRPNTATVIPVVDDKILVTVERQPNHTQASTTIPGGRCEPNEDSRVAAERELLEETGYTADDWHLLLATQPVSKIDWTVYVYVARNCRKLQEPHLDNGEEITSKLVTFDEFLMLADDPTFWEQHLVPLMLRARLNPVYREELHVKIFGV